MPDNQKKQGKKGHSGGTAVNIVTSVFAFFLSIAILALGAFSVAKIVLSKGYLVSCLDDRYYGLLMQKIQDDAHDYTLPVGLPVTVLDGVFTNDQIREDVLETLDYAFNGENHQVSTTHLEEKLTQNVEAFFASEHAEIDDDADAGIDAYVEEIGDIYLERISIPCIGIIVGLAQKVDTLIYIGLAASLLAAAVLGIICFKIQRYPHRGLRYMAYATGGAALMSFAAPAFILLRKQYERLLLNPEFFYHFAINYVRRALLLCLGAAAVWLVVTLLLVWISVVRRRKALAKYRSRHLHDDHEDRPDVDQKMA